MYIELYIIDNMLMNALILRLASAMLSVKAGGIRLWLTCALGAAYAVFAYMYPLLLAMPFKVILCLFMALGIPFSGIRGYILRVVAVFLSTCLIGGAAFAIALGFGGTVEAGTVFAPLQLRVALIIAAAATMLPSLFRRILQRRTLGTLEDRLIIRLNGKRYSLKAMIDSGNTLTAPGTSLPVIVVTRGAFDAAPDSPVPILIHCETAAGEAELLGFIPDSLQIGDVAIQALIAVGSASERRNSRDSLALIPPSAIPAEYNKEDFSCVRGFGHFCSGFLKRFTDGCTGKGESITSERAKPSRRP